MWVMEKLTLSLTAFVMFAAATPTRLYAADAWAVPPDAAGLKNPLPGDNGTLARGKSIFEDRCADCHGQKGKGDGPAAADFSPKPGDLTKAAMREQPDGVLFWKISEGKKPMPPYKSKISEEDRWKLVNYVRTLTAQK